MILLKEQLEQCLHNKTIHFSGEIRKDSFLLTLGDTIQPISQQANEIDPYLPFSNNLLYVNPITNWKDFKLAPHQFVLCATKEYISFNAPYFGLISTLSHIARLGLMAHASSYFVDRNFSGYLTFEIVNLTCHTFVLHNGMPFAKLAIVHAESFTPTSQTTNEKEAYYGELHELRSRFFDEYGV